MYMHTSELCSNMKEKASFRVETCTILLPGVVVCSSLESNSNI
jgi:hypothetical protein